MARFLKTTEHDIGFPPDALQFRGEKRTEHTGLTMVNYNERELNEVELSSLDELVAYRKAHPHHTTWFNIDGIHDEKVMREISTKLNLEPMILSDVMNPHGRPKLQEYENCLYLSVKMLQLHKETKEVTSENIVLLIMDQMLITFQEDDTDVFAPVCDRLYKNRKRIRSSGPAYLAFALLDLIISHYMYILSSLGTGIEKLEDNLLQDVTIDTLETIKHYKGELSYLRKAVKPCQEVIHDLAREESEFFGDHLEIHLNELQNDIMLTAESIETYRETLSDQLNFYHSTVSSKLNDIMKFLTIISVIFTPLMFIVGVYGTNFENLPEVHLSYGYFMMWGVMILITIGMVFYFKLKKWL